MNNKSLIILLCIGIFLFSFSNKKEISKITNEDLKSERSLVQTTELLKLEINSPMMLGEYTAKKNDYISFKEAKNNKIVFIPNKGQIIDTDGNLRPDILYKASLNGVDLYLTKKGLSFVFYDYKYKFENLASEYGDMNEETSLLNDDFVKDIAVKMYRMDLDIIGMNERVSVLNEGTSEEYYNYYFAHCPEGITYVHGYKKVVFENVYDNIDLVFNSNDKGLKYDFIVKPGGNVSDIKMKYMNEDKVYITEEGKIKATNPFGELETNVLYTYQSDGKIIESSYQKDSDGMIRIFTEDYDRTKDLIIDPYIGASYFGGGSFDYGESITTDENNKIYITGTTSSGDFPLCNPGGGAYYQDSVSGLFISSFISQGILQWSTEYGGSYEDFKNSIITDGNNNVLVSGYSESPDLPLHNPGGGAYYQEYAGATDAFILKFNSSGIRQWATFYGGSGVEGSSSIAEGKSSVAIDGNNNILVTGVTKSIDFPLQNPGGGAYFQGSFAGGATDAFILKFSPNGIRHWATYYGGSNEEIGSSITADGNDNILVTGVARSTDFPVCNPGGGAYFQGTNAGLANIFILKFNSGGIRQWATYYGGNTLDKGFSITTDGSNNVLVTGYANSINFPVQDPGGGAYYQGTKAGHWDSFILKFNSNCVRQWATYYGGNRKDQGNSIATDGDNNILITGFTLSMVFPLQDPSGGAYFQDTLEFPDTHAFILKFNSDGHRFWATYYGGSHIDKANSITSDGNNYIYVTGETFSTDFPVYNPGGFAYYQDTKAGYYDAFLLGFTPVGAVTGIKNLTIYSPSGYTLYQNYPNPFNPTTKIKFDLPKSTQMKLVIYDILGREVATLVNEKLNAGSYLVDWPAPSGDGSSYPSGVYFYKLITKDFSQTKRMVLVK